MTASTLLAAQSPDEVADEEAMAAPDKHRDLIDCPARRLGKALRLHRESVGQSLEEISKRVNFSFTPIVLQMIEAGQYPLEPAQVLIAVWGYDADPNNVLPIRDVLRFDEADRKFAAGPTVRDLHQSFTPAGLLYEYLAFVYDLRGMEPGSTVPLREADLAVLSNTTGWPMDEVREHLTVLMARWGYVDPHETQSLARQNRTGVLGASVPVGLRERLHQNTSPEQASA